MHASGRTTHISCNAGIGAALMALSRHQPPSSSSSTPTPNFPSNASISALNPVPTTRLSYTHFQSTSESSSDSDSPSESPSEDPSKNSSDSSSNCSCYGTGSGRVRDLEGAWKKSGSRLEELRSIQEAEGLGFNSCVAPSCTQCPISEADQTEKETGGTEVDIQTGDTGRNI